MVQNVVWSIDLFPGAIRPHGLWTTRTVAAAERNEWLVSVRNGHQLADNTYLLVRLQESLVG
jgi:hypothetical protein